MPLSPSGSSSHGWRGDRPRRRDGAEPPHASAQLIPELFGDPFGHGWKLLGGWNVGLDAAPLGDAGLLWAQLAVLLGGFAAGAVVLGRRLDRGDRPPAALLLSVLASAAVIAVITH